MKPLQSRPHQVVMLTYDDAQVLDITGPLEVFGRSGRWLKDNGYCHDAAYTVELVGLRSGPVRTSSGIELLAKRSFRDVRPRDTLLITGGIGYREAAADEQVLAWIRQAAGTVKRIGSICTGAMILAAAGVLRGARATTHWAYCGELERQIGDERVDRDSIFVRDGNVYTSAGVTTGIDMALAMVEEDWGRPVALAVAQELVLYLKRPGGQSQFSRQLAAQNVECPAIQRLLQWINENPGENLRVDRLAEQVNMSPRNFARRFRREVGTTPARYIEQVRVERARRRLEESRAPLERVARASGFRSSETMRRGFLRHLGIPPGQYRDRFGRGQ